MNRSFLQMIILFSFIISFGTTGNQVAYADIPCGTVVSSPGTYTLSANKTCDGTWVTVSANNVIIDGGGYTVTYGNLTAAKGVTLSPSPQNFEMHHVTISQGTVAASADSSEGCEAVFANTNSLNGLNIHDNTITTTAPVSSAMRFKNLVTAGQVINIYNNTLNISPSSVPTSSYYPNGIWFDGKGINFTATGSIYGNIITVGKNTGHSDRPSAITPPNGSTAEKYTIHDNIITLNGSINHGVRMYGVPYVKVYNNTITASSSSDNIRAILSDGASNYNEIYGNTIIINSNNTTSSSYGIRIRYATIGNVIHDNIIDTSGSSGIATHAIAPGGDQAPTIPSGPVVAEIFGNTITAGTKDTCFYTYGSLVSSNIYCNTCTKPGGYAISGTTDGTSISNNEFAHNTYTIGGTDKRINLYAGLNYTNNTFCAESVNGIAMALIDFNGMSGGVSIVQNECVKHCSGPSAPKNTKVINVVK